MPTNRIALVIICSILAACDGADERGARDEVAVAAPELPTNDANEPQYGEAERIAGRFDFRFEVSAFFACSDRETCEADADGSCWAIFSPQASDDATRFTGSENFQSEGSFWLEGEGRIATEPGHFGHLNLYRCQVEFTAIDALDPLEN